MGNSQQKTWLMDNVLFLDEASLNEATTVSNYYGGGSSKGGARQHGHGADRRRGARRYIPSQAMLRNLSFNITLELNGKDVGFILKCCNDPLALIFCDSSGKALREVPRSKITSIEKRDACAVRVDLSDGGDVHAALDLNFSDSKECATFVDTVKMMYGIYVHEFGTRPKAKQRAQKGLDASKGRGQHGECLIHGGSTECSCSLQRPSLSTGKNVQGESSSEDEEDASTAVHSSKFPVAITGNSDAGVALSFKDLSTGGHRVQIRAVEWFVALEAGKDPQFPSTPTSSSNDFVLADRHVGHYIQVRVVRRTNSSSLESHHDFVYSLATKGPCTVNDATAGRILKVLCNSPFKVDIQVPQENVCEFFPYGYAVTDKPFFEGHLYVRTTGISLEVPAGGDSSAPLSITWQWESFIPVRPQLDADTATAADDLYLALDAYNYGGEFSRLYVAMPNEEERDCIFHALTFYRLSQGHKGFERWFQDFERGNFGVLKQRYAKLWSTVLWSKYYTATSAAETSTYEGYYAAAAAAAGTAHYRGAEDYSEPPGGGAQYQQQQQQQQWQGYEGYEGYQQWQQ
eukprot:Lankesteria_metandrocarpae@DN2869_c0_g1_i1.p1